MAKKTLKINFLFTISHIKHFQILPQGAILRDKFQI